MKKLLSILAALGISATAMTTVVACGVSSKYPITQEPEKNTGGNNSGGTGDKNGSGWESGNKSDREDPSDPTRPPVEPNVYDSNENIKAIFTQAIRRTIYQDQFGFNQQYLDEQLFNNRTSLVPEKGSLTPNSSGSDFINYYLNKIEGDVILNGDKGSKTAEPFFDFLPANVQPTVKTVVDVLKNADFVTPTTLLGALNTATNLLGGVNPLANLILGYQDKVLTISEPLLTNPQIKGMVDHWGDYRWLEQYQDYTLIDSQKIIVNGLAWILGLGAGEEAKVALFGTQMGDVKQFSAATDYLVDLIGRLVNKEVAITGQNYAKFIFSNPETKEVNQANLSTLVNNGFVMVSMLSAYLQAFGDYKLANPSDANHIFSATETNWAVISGVRNTKLKDLAVTGALDLNLRALIANLDYYLGDLNNDTGMYRLQALCAILFLDENGQAADKLTIDWNNKTKIIDYEKVTPLTYVLTQMISEVVNLDKILPGFVKTLLSILGYDISNETISVTFYQLLESFSTQKSLQFSTAMYNSISKPGTRWSTNPYIDINWFNTLFTNPLSFLYSGDLISWLDALPGNIKGTSLVSNGVAATARGLLKDPLEKATTSMKELAVDGQLNLKVLFSLPLDQILTIAKAGVFNQNLYRFPPNFASAYTNQDIAGLADSLAELVNVNKMDNNAALKDKGFDLNQVKAILQTLWIKDEKGADSNLIKEFFFVLKNYNGSQRVDKINNLLGIVGMNKYDTSKILGRLLIFLTPGLDTPANTGTMKINNQEIKWISGDYRLGSPLLSKMKNLFLNIWTSLNVPTNYDQLLKTAWTTDQDNHAFEEQLVTYKYKVEGNDTSSLLKANQVVTFKWTSPNGTVNSTTYNFELVRTSSKTPFTLKVDKQATV